MPETLEGRERIIQYLNANDITIADLAAMYGIAKQDMSDYLSGRKRITRKQNHFENHFWFQDQIGGEKYGKELAK